MITSSKTAPIMIGMALSFVFVSMMVSNTLIKGKQEGIETNKITEENLIGDEDREQKIYWDLSCPWEINSASVSQYRGDFFDYPEYLERPRHQTREEYKEAANVAREYSLSHNTPERVKTNANAFKGRRTLIVGDSLSRQMFVALACLLPEDMIKLHVTPWKRNVEHAVEFFTSRILLKPSGEIHYNPRAGGINYYDWGNGGYGGFHNTIKKTGWSKDPTEEPIPHEGMDWITSCHERKPFQFTTNSIPLIQTAVEHDEIVKVEHQEWEEIYETITLTSNDVVVISAGVHSPRPENLKSLEDLLDCMDAAKQDGTDWDWPQIAYVKTTMKHYENIDGYNLCSDTNYHTEDEEYEKEKFADRMQVIAQDIDLTELGYLHVKAQVPDCVHWLQPGLPDLFAAELAEYVGSL